MNGGNDMMTETILITGAGSGLGKLTALTLGKMGKKVIATTETTEQADLLREDAEALRIPLQIEKLDITNEHDRKRAWTWDIDVLVNNASIKEGGALIDIPEENFRNQFEVNVIGTVLLTQGFARQMIDKGYGRIVFVSSISGLMVNAFSGPYSSSKFATEAIANTLAQELQEFNIEVATINPGPFLTGFNDEEFERYRTWNDDPEERIFNYRNLHFPFPQMEPKKAVAPMIRVILGQTKMHRNLIPRSLSFGVIGNQIYQWLKKTHWRSGERHSLVIQSNEMQPATKM